MAGIALPDYSDWLGVWTAFVRMLYPSALLQSRSLLLALLSRLLAVRIHKETSL